MAGNEDPKAAADALISEGVDKGNEKDFEGAAAKFEEATRSDPTSVKAFLLLGTAKLAVGDLTGAAAACERALELAREPNDKSQAHFVLGAVRRGLGDLTGALESFFAAAQLTQADELRQNDIFFALMEALVDVGQLEQVEAALEKCPKKDSETWALRGRLYAKKYNFEQADKAFEESLKMEPTATAHFWRARVRRDRGLYDAALQDLTSALERDPGQALVLQERAALHALLAQQAKARKDPETQKHHAQCSDEDLQAAHLSTKPVYLIGNALVPGADKESMRFSPFAMEYESATPPSSVAELKRSIKDMLAADGGEDNDSFYKKIETQIDQHPGDSVAEAAERFWTSALQNERGREPCSIVSSCVRFRSHAIQEDAPKARAVAPVARAINLNLTTNRSAGLGRHFFPTGGKTLRGSSLPPGPAGWFASRKGEKIRIPNFFATAMETEPGVSKSFMKRAFTDPFKPPHERAPVLWEILFDERGNPDHKDFSKDFVCKNANLITKKVDGLGDEKEVLFVAFSVFTIQDVQLSPNPTPDNPHRIWLRAAIDNKREKEDLPLAPWS